MTLDAILTILIVAIAAIFFIRRLIKNYNSSKTATLGCGTSCGGCPHKPDPSAASCGAISENSIKP